MLVRRSRVEREIEDKILTAMIVSDDFCRNAIPFMDPALLQSPHAQIVVRWVLEYYKTYNTAPGATIREIFNARKMELEDADSRMIETYLTNLSAQFEEDPQINVDYALDQTTNYLRRRNVEVLTDTAKALIVDGKVDMAEAIISGYKNVARTLSPWVNPFTDENIREAILTEEETLFQLPGKLGELLGGFQRGWLIGFMGPMKRGKTWWLQEVAIQALLSRLRVAFVSLEMDWKTIARRMYKRITATGDARGMFVYPVFDCAFNQDGTCQKAERKNRLVLLDAEGNPPPFRIDNPYQICDFCRDKPHPIGANFGAALWYIANERAQLYPRDIRHRVGGVKRMFGDNIRIIGYPAYEANVADIKRAMDVLEDTEGFVPDVLVVDYADILRPEDARLTGRDRISETWMMLKNTAQKRHLLVCTASQTTREAIDKKNVTQKDTPEDIRKIAIADAMFTLNQTRAEKRKKVMRIGTMIHRHRAFDEFRHVHVLQQFDLGQTALDSDFLYEREQEEPAAD